MEKVFFHISGPSLNWLSMKTLPNSLALSNVNYFLIRLKAWSFYWAVRHRFSICFLKFKAVSIVILSNSTLSGSLTVIDRMFRLNSKQFFFPSILTWNFPGFALSELILNQWRRFSYHVQTYSELRQGCCHGNTKCYHPGYYKCLTFQRQEKCH